MVFAGNYLVEFPKTPLDTFVYILAQWIIPWHTVTRKSKIVSMQNLGAKNHTHNVQQGPNGWQSSN